MEKIVRLCKRGLAAILCLGMILPYLPSDISFAATIPTVYAAAYQDSTGLVGTTLPSTVDEGGVQTAVTWNFKNNIFLVPYDTVEVTGTTANGSVVTAQVEVIPKQSNELLYFIDASRDTGKESKAYTSVYGLTSATLKNKVADQVYNATDNWGRNGSNFLEKGTSNIDVTKKIQSGWYSNSKTVALTYQYYLEPGTYTLTTGFREWWNGRSMKLALSGTGMTSVTSDTITISGVGSSAVKSINFTVDTACVVSMQVQNTTTTGEAPVISWFGVAKGNVVIPEKPMEAKVVINGADVDAAAENKNGLTYKGYGLLSGNSTSNLLMDYKEESPAAYQEMLQVLFGGDHPLMDHVKMEMGNDGNNSTGADSCTMRFENEEADVSRSPGFQLAADAKAINPDLKISILRWEMPAWVSSAWSTDQTGAGYEAVYKWYKETIFDAYEKYGYMIDYLDPDKNETTDPNESFIKWIKNRIVNETSFPSYMDTAAIDAYHNIKIIASDENQTLNIVPSMRADSDLYNAIDAIGFHYNTGESTTTTDYRKMADVDDKEVWYSEGFANFSYTEYQKNKTIAYGKDTIGGFQSSLGLADVFVKSFVYSRKTHYIFQPAIGSFYEGAQYDHKEIISAREPWAGSIHYDPMIYLLQHFTKFAKTGWENESNTAGIWRVIANASNNTSSGTEHLSNESGNPSYMTLAAPDKSDFSVVMVNNSAKTVNYEIQAVNMNLAAGAPLEIWETKTDSYLQYKGEASYSNGSYTLSVAPFSMVTVTSLDCDGKAEYTDRLPAETEKSVLDTDVTGKTLDTTDNILYADDFEYSNYPTGYLASRGNEPRYIVDLSGAYAVENGQLKHLLKQSVGQWNSNTPNCIVGDFRWMNYKASVDVTVTGSSYAGINIRQQTGMGFEGSGYNLQITKAGNWTLKRMGTTLSSGKVTADLDGTYNLALEGRGGLITAWVDGVEVTTYLDANPQYFGRVRLGCGWEETYFDNLVVEKIPGYAPYATELIDNASDEVSYTGTWDTIVAGNGASNLDWYRSTSTTTTANSSFSFNMTGAGFALLGANDGTAKLDVQVDGTTVATDATTNSCNQHYSTYIYTGNSDASHTVTVTVKSGKLVLDAIDILPYSATDKTMLNDLITQANNIANDGYITSTWDAMITARDAAQIVANNSNVTQNEIDSAYITLKNAIEGLLKATDVVAAEKLYVAAYSNETLTLPSTISCTTADGNTVSKEVIWNTGSVSKLTNYDTITVDGIVKDDGFIVSANVEVVPVGLQYFVNVGTGIGYFNNNTVAAVSKPYDVVSSLVANLKNTSSDAAYSTTSGWGYVYDSTTYKVSATIDGGDRPNSYTSTDKYSVGLRDKTSGAKPMIYRFTLEPGTYELTTGYHEFYGAGRVRDMQPSVVWTDSNGIEQTVNGSVINLRSANTKGTISFTLDTTATVEFRLAFVGGEPGMYSWLGLAKVQPVDKSTLASTIDTAKLLDGTNYTVDSFAAVTTALTTAESVMADSTATQAVINAATADLIAAMNALVVKPTISYIQINKAPLKVQYVTGEALDLTGLEVSVYMSDGSSNVITDQSQFNVTGYDATFVGDQTVTVTYQGMQTTFVVHVIALDPNVTIVGIDIKNLPNKVNYVMGQALNLTGLAITVNMSDGSMYDVVDLNQLDVTGYDVNTLGEQVLTVTYQGQTATFTVNVTEDTPSPVIESIAISNAPNKVNYALGESLDLTGLVITATYSDNSQVEINDLSQLTTVGYNGSVAGVQTITVGYQEKTAEFTVIVRANETPNDDSEHNDSDDTKEKDDTQETKPVDLGKVETVKALPSENGNAEAISVDITTKVENTKAVVTVEVPLDTIKKALEGKDTTKQPVSIAIPLASTDTLVEKLASKEVKNAEVTITVDQSILKDSSKAVISEIQADKELLEAVKDNNKTLSVNVADEKGNIWYSWSFNSKQMNLSNDTLEDLNLAVNLVTSDTDAKIDKLIDNAKKNTDGYILSLATEGDMPSGTVLKINVNEKLGLESGDSLYLYHYNEKTNTFDSIPKTKYVVGKDGCISVNVKYGDKYVILENSLADQDNRTLKEQVQLPSTKVTMEEGKSQYVGLQFTDVLGKVTSFTTKDTQKYGKEVAPVKITYTTSNKSVAVVNKNGKITAKKEGKVTITATVTFSNGSKTVLKKTVTVK